jgi:hypothetical protein
MTMAASMNACRSAQQPTASNRLLEALPAGEFARLAPHLELVSLPLGAALYEARAAQSHVYFPTSAIVSMLYLLENGDWRRSQ